MSNKKINLVMDASQLDTFQACEWKFYLRYILNKESIDKAQPLERGTVLHAGKEAYYKALQSGLSWETAVDSCLLEAKKAAVISGVITSRTKKDWITVDFLIDTLERECKRHKLTDLSYTIHNVEESFAYVVYEDDNVRFVLIGKIDLLVDAPPNYQKVPIDHKSHTRDFGVHRFRNQFINYAIATNSNFLIVNRIGLQEKMDDVERFKRVPLSFDPVYKEQWKANTVKWFWRYYDCLAAKSNNEENAFPQNLTSCDKYNRECEYLEYVCDVSGKESQTYRLNTFFRDGEVWDVSKTLSVRD